MNVFINLTAHTTDEQGNLLKVTEHVEALSKVPTVKAIAVMPDACPAGQEAGTIPVGGVVNAGANIHPGMHSADVCCSMAYTNFGSLDPKLVLDAAHRSTHFGVGGRREAEQLRPDADLLAKMENNPFLWPVATALVSHFATQGDGNHFLYVGTLTSTGDTVMVTHHGSRGPGAGLYKEGMRVAQQYCRDFINGGVIGKHNAWIPRDTIDGMHYWNALQLIRRWTKASHFAIHDMVANTFGVNPVDRFWNEHNFVFERGGDFYHAKGATPNYAGFSADDDGRTLIPLNCAAPILIAGHRDSANGLGFAPHGAGRNLSRKAHLRNLEGRSPEEVFAMETKGLDVRAFNGVPDLSELPSAYKDATKIQAEIAEFGLADVTDTILPYGSIMAGDAPWRVKKRKKLETV